MDPEELEAMRQRLLTTVGQRRRAPPIFYETSRGPATFRRDPDDPTQGYFEGDDFYVAWDDEPDARPVFAGPQPERGPDNFRVPERARRSVVDRFLFDAWEAQNYGSGFVQAFPHPESGRREWTTAESAQRAADRALQGQMAQEDSFMRYFEEGDVGAGVAHGSAALGGTLAGAISDPLNLFSAGASWVGRVLFQGVLGGAQNADEQLSGQSESRFSAEQHRALGIELDRIYREEGVEGLDQALSVLEDHDEERGFDWLELGIAAAGSAGLQGLFEGVGHVNATRALRQWRRARAEAEAEGPDVLRDFIGANPQPPGYLGMAASRFAGPFIRAAARGRIRSLGDPALDQLARLEDGSIDPGAIPADQAFAVTPVWVRQMAPVVERAGTALSAEQRALAYSEAALRLSEAMARGEDPITFTNALAAAQMTGALPDLRAFRVLEGIAREISNGTLVLDQLGGAARRLSDLAERLDPAIANWRSRRARFRASLREADQALDASRRAEAEARPPTEVGVGEGHLPERRLVTEEERGEIDALAAQVAAGRAERTGLDLAAWTVKKGGVGGSRGDLAAAIGGGRARPGLINEKGHGADDLARMAYDEGFFHDLGREPTGDELIQALSDQVSGRRAYYPLEGQEALALNQALREAENFLDRHGIDPTERDPETLKRQIAERVYDATYAEPVDGGGDSAAGGDVSPRTPGASGASAQERQAPQGWGAGRTQGGGGAMLSPLGRVEQTITPIERQTLWRRAARSARRRGVSTYVTDVIARAYTAIFEAQHPLVMQQRTLVREIERAAGASIDMLPSENAAVLARLSRDSYSAGHLDLSDGVRPYRQPGVKSSPSFREAIEKATGGREWTPERLTRFEAYLIAKRAVKAWDRYANGDLPRPPHAMSKLDLSDAIRQAEADHPEFVDASDLLYRFLAAHWKKKRDAGFITDEQYQQGLVNNEDYVPFQRDMDDSGADPSRGGDEGNAPPTSGGRSNKRKAFQRFRGSDRRILSPLSTIMADVYATSDRIARNEAYRAFTALAERAGPMGEMIAKKLPTPMDRTHIDIVEEAERAIRAAGGSPVDAKALGGQLDALLNGETSRVIYRPGDVVEGGRKVIYVWRDGKREAWELTDPEWADDLFKAMTGLTQEARDMFVDIVAMPTQAIRTSIIAWPGFVFANLMRDSLSAWMVTDLGYKPGLDIAIGSVQTLTKGKLAKLYNAVGTMGGGMVRAGLPRTKVQRDLPALRGKVLRMRNLDPREGASTLWRGFEAATELSESASRIRLFGRGFERAKREGMSDYDAALWAAYESRDYMDFQRSGSKMLNFRRVALFLNAALQGLDRTMRTMSAEGDGRALLRPLVNMMQGRTKWDGLTPQQRYEVGRAHKYWAKLALVGVFGLMLRALWGDDEDYVYGHSDYVKNNYWLIEVGGYALAIPKPFEHAVLSNIFERAYEAQVLQDPQAWDRLVSGLGETYIPPHEITAANIPIQLYANRSYTGAPIVPMGLEDLDPHLQYSAYTSQLSINFASALWEHTGIDVSPSQLDHVFSGVGGDFFRQPSRVLDGDAPAMNASDVPVLNRFLREPGRGGTPQRVAFNDAVMRTSASLNRAAGTLRDIRERGAVEEARRFLEDREPFERTYAVLQVGFDTEARRLHPMSRARNVVTEIGRIRRELQGSRALASETLFLPEMTARERRNALEALDDVSSAEMQAALVMGGAPDFAGRPMMDVPARYDRLETVAPAVAALLRARLLSGSNRAVEFDTVRELWPEAERRIEADGFRAQLGDLASVADADFGSASLRGLELEMLGGSRRTRQERDRAYESFEEEAQP